MRKFYKLKKNGVVVPKGRVYERAFGPEGSNLLLDTTDYTYVDITKLTEPFEEWFKEIPQEKIETSKGSILWAWDQMRKGFIVESNGMYFRIHNRNLEYALPQVRSFENLFWKPLTLGCIGNQPGNHPLVTSTSVFNSNEI